MSNYIELSNIVKIYPPNTVALNDVTVVINRGEILSIIGENGAGKSTLMKVLYGLEESNSGEISIEGNKVNIKSPNDAINYKIGMVHQEFMLIPEFTVMENILLGVEPTKKGFIEFEEAEKHIKVVQSMVHQELSLNSKIKDLSIAAQQKVEIMKQLYRDVDVLILDEPTAVLTPQESQELFKLLRELKESGKSIVFISHKLGEVLEISDRITIMRKGEHIWTKPNVGLSREDLANAMVGREVLFTLNKEMKPKGNLVLSVERLSSKSKSKSALKDVSFEIYENQIVGIAGVEGNGQFELVQAITSHEKIDGKIHVNGIDISDMNVHEKRYHFAYVPQDRKSLGSSQDDSLYENIMMTHHYMNDQFIKKFNFLNFNKIKEFASSVLSKYQVSTDNIDLSMSSLSGGNQQKILLGRELELNRNFLIVDQPVRGLDVGSIEYVHNSILEKRSNHTACLLISADLDEIFNLADIIIVMFEGKIIAVKETSETNKLEIGNYMLGVASHEKE